MVFDVIYECCHSLLILYVAVILYLYVVLYELISTAYSNNFVLNGKKTQTRVYENHLKMVSGCRIGTGLYKEDLSSKDPEAR